MDYEKEYKEAFKRAERRFDPNPVDGYAGYANGIIEDIFPQFIKREDERTRKEILDFIKRFWVDHKDSIPRISSWLDWLEKQKEQKQVECIDFDNEFENQVSHLLASILNGEHEYNEGFVKYAAQSLLGYAKSEMKPDEWDKREKLFTKALQTANTQIGQLFEENRKLKEQKPIEWSEEDSRMLSDIAGYISGVGSSSGITKRERVDFLYGLPKRFNLQPKPEWSEKDEIMIGSLINYFEGDALDCSTEDVVNWLKSLRPQSHWKPSKEQMKALYSALNDAISLYSNKVSPSYEEISRMHFDILESLYNDLKKL